MTNSYRPPAKDTRHGGRSDAADSYQPEHGKGNDAPPTQRPPPPPPKRRRTDRWMPTKDDGAAATASPSTGTGASTRVLRSAATKSQGPRHSKAERKRNRSTRIHSLRRLLARDTLPPEERRVKERELAGLVHEQVRERTTRTKRQVTQRYHMVRFFERKKAERRLKQLLRQQHELERPNESKDERPNHPSDDDTTGNNNDDANAMDMRPLERLARDIHRARVDVNYTLYAPLGEKYIGIFADEKTGQNAGHEDEITVRSNEESGVVKLARPGDRPPMWYEVERCMQTGDGGPDDDEAAVKRRLEALRDRLPAQTRQSHVEGAVALRSSAGGRTKTTSKPPAWLDEHGHIDPEDVDKDSDGDDIMGDGGFFEH